MKMFNTEELKIYVRRENFQNLNPKSLTVGFIKGETFEDLVTGQVYSLRQNPVTLKDNNECGAYIYSLRLIQKPANLTQLLPSCELDEEDWTVLRKLTQICRKEQVSLKEINDFVETVNQEIEVIYKKIEEQKQLEKENNEKE